MLKKAKGNGLLSFTCRNELFERNAGLCLVLCSSHEMILGKADAEVEGNEYYYFSTF